MRHPVAALTVAAALVSGAIALASCGSEEGNPPPAETADSPPLSAKPVGEVIRGSSEAEGIAVDAKTGLAAISYRDPSRIELLDVGTGKVTRRISTPEEARHLELAKPGGPVLVPVEYRDRLLRIALPSGRVVCDVKVGDFPHDAAQAPGGLIFVTDEGGDMISVVTGNKALNALPVPEQPGGLAISDGTLAVVTAAAREMAFYDVDSFEQTAVLPGGAGPSHVVAGDDGRFYVADTGGDALLVYEGGGEPRLLDRTNLAGSPYGLAIDNRRGRIWVTRTARNEVTELAITGLAPKIVASYPTVRQPNSVGVDERTGEVVVVSRDDGDVQIFDPKLATPVEDDG